MQLFRMMNETLGSTILMVTHDAAVGSYADRVLFLQDGRSIPNFAAANGTAPPLRERSWKWSPR